MGVDAVLGSANKWLDYMNNPHKYPDEHVTRERAERYAEACIRELENPCFDGVPNIDSIVKSKWAQLRQLQDRV